MLVSIIGESPYPTHGRRLNLVSPQTQVYDRPGEIGNAGISSNTINCWIFVSERATSGWPEEVFYGRRQLHALVIDWRDPVDRASVVPPSVVTCVTTQLCTIWYLIDFFGFTTCQKFNSLLLKTGLCVWRPFWRLIAGTREGELNMYNYNLGSVQ